MNNHRQQLGSTHPGFDNNQNYGDQRLMAANPRDSLELAQTQQYNGEYGKDDEFTYLHRNLASQSQIIVEDSQEDACTGYTQNSLLHDLNQYHVLS